MSGLETRKKQSEDDEINCKLCNASFQTLEACLAHELRYHTVKKLRKYHVTVRKLFESAQIQSERRILKESLAKAPPGQHLNAVLAFYTADSKEFWACFSEMQDILRREFRGQLKVYPFGSLVTGLALKDSDIDLFLEQTNSSQNSMSHWQMFDKVLRILHRSYRFKKVLPIRNARVPIIRCKHVNSGLSLDINMSSPMSTYNSRFLTQLLGLDLRLRELFLFIKLWGKTLKVIGKGSMSCYCLITLIIFGLQQHQLLPSIKQLQLNCQTLEIMGINYAYCIQRVNPIPANVTTLDLISNFFELYSKMEFEKKLLSPYLGYALDRETALTPDQFPEYEEHLKAIQLATGEQPEGFQNQRYVSIQDPFELLHNVGKSICLTNLCYFRQCLALAHKACSDKRLTSSPEEFYDYLLFGLPQNLLQPISVKDFRAKLCTQMLVQTDQTNPGPVAQMEVNDVEGEVAVAENMTNIAATAASAVTDIQACEPMPVISAAAVEPTNGSVKKVPSITHLYFVRPRKRHLRSLPSYLDTIRVEAGRTIFFYWVKCYVRAIKTILLEVYGMNLRLIEPVEIQEVEEVLNSSKTPPFEFTWLINTSLDTWSGRTFTCTTNTNKFFIAQQIVQSIEFLKNRSSNAEYVVNLSGRFSLGIGANYKHILLELQPMTDEVLGDQRNSPLTKFFNSLKNMLTLCTEKVVLSDTCMLEPNTKSQQYSD